MSLLSLVIVLIVVGTLLWCVNTYGTKLDPKVKTLINVVVIVAMVIYCLVAFGVWDDLKDVKVPK